MSETRKVCGARIGLLVLVSITTVGTALAAPADAQAASKSGAATGGAAIQGARPLTCVESRVSADHNDGSGPGTFTCPGSSVVMGLTLACSDDTNRRGSGGNAGGDAINNGHLTDVRFTSPSGVRWGIVFSMCPAGALSSIVVTCCQ